jgi:FAD/FMN-containing dehydrogenase
VTAGAGYQLGDLYKAAIDKDLLVVGGDSKTVGLGGYLTGGGHSPLGAVFGLAVDNIVEIQMVTPTGDLVTANECLNSDLFWAMKGVCYESDYGHYLL